MTLTGASGGAQGILGLSFPWSHPLFFFTRPRGPEFPSLLYTFLMFLLFRTQASVLSNTLPRPRLLWSVSAGESPPVLFPFCTLAKLIKGNRPACPQESRQCPLRPQEINHKIRPAPSTGHSNCPFGSVAFSLYAITFGKRNQPGNATTCCWLWDVETLENSREVTHRSHHLIT